MNTTVQIKHGQGHTASSDTTAIRKEKNAIAAIVVTLMFNTLQIYVNISL